MHWANYWGHGGEQDRTVSAVVELSTEDKLLEQEYIEYIICNGKLKNDMQIFSKEVRWAI